MLSEMKLRCFSCVARTLNFRKAAQELYMTPQAVNKNILELERSIGTPLFLREKNGLSLTADGSAFLHIAERFLAEYDAWLESLHDEHMLNRPLRVGCMPFEMSPIYYKACARAQAAVPPFQVVFKHYQVGELIQRMYQGELDMIIATDGWMTTVPSAKRKKLLHMPNVLLVSARNPKAKEDAKYSDFAEEALVVDAWENESREATLARFREAISILNFHPPKIIVCPNRESVYTAVSLNSGIAIGGNSYAPAVLSGDIRRYPCNLELVMSYAWATDDNRLLQYIHQYARYLALEYGKEGYQVLLES
ncbi:MAG: LysR family transcriptional regulator [Lachnospiraceae bacterium]|nr:LysR family transcriptional regulator [Lachnospiraceae bacterium]